VGDVSRKRRDDAQAEEPSRQSLNALARLLTAELANQHAAVP